MRIQVELPLRFYGLFERAIVGIERIATATESIDQTLKATEDFTDEDQTVLATTQSINEEKDEVDEAKKRIPHGT